MTWHLLHSQTPTGPLLPQNRPAIVTAPSCCCDADVTTADVALSITWFMPNFLPRESNCAPFIPFVDRTHVSREVVDRKYENRPLNITPCQCLPWVTIDSGRPDTLQLQDIQKISTISSPFFHQLIGLSGSTIRFQGRMEMVDRWSSGPRCCRAATGDVIKYRIRSQTCVMRRTAFIHCYRT